MQDYQKQLQKAHNNDNQGTPFGRSDKLLNSVLYSRSMKNIILESQSDVSVYVELIRENAGLAQTRLADIAERIDDLAFLERIKFETIGLDLNFIEQVHQTFTFLASLRAAEHLFLTHRNIENLQLNLGTSSGSDIESTPRGIIAGEVFAATRPSSNNKLNKDVQKVMATEAINRYVFFLCPGIDSGEYQSERFPGVCVWSLGLENITSG